MGLFVHDSRHEQVGLDPNMLEFMHMGKPSRPHERETCLITDFLKQYIVKYSKHSQFIRHRLACLLSQSKKSCQLVLDVSNC